jgi:hypothetical protein
MGDYAGVPAQVLHYRRRGDHDLHSFLEEHTNKPSDLPGEKRNFRHDLLESMIALSPDIVGFPEGLQPYNEVELPLCDRIQHRLYNEVRRWPLTVVDNVFYGTDDLRVLGVITSDASPVVDRELKGLERAVKFFYYNFGVQPESFLVIGKRRLRCRKLAGPWLNPSYRGIFS